MKLISDNSYLWDALRDLKNEFIAASVCNDGSIQISDIETDFKTLVRELEGQEALDKMRDEITRRKTNLQEAQIQVMNKRLNRLETELSILKGEPQPEVGEN